MSELIKRNIFFAFSWDAEKQKNYEEIFIKHKGWEIIRNVYWGSESKTTPIYEGEIEKFRLQNKQLFDLFVRRIEKSDIFVADLSDLNPNVMVELGIAIHSNKNVLFLSGGVPPEKMPFDIRGYEILTYKNVAELKKKIDKYIETYTRIKSLSFESKPPGSYYGSESDDIEEIKSSDLNNREGGPTAYKLLEVPFLPQKIKDCKVRVDYKIEKYGDLEDWFGFLLRATPGRRRLGTLAPLHHPAILINARANGKTDITLYPEIEVVKQYETHKKHDGQTFRRLEFILDGNNIIILDEKGKPHYKNVELNSFGKIYLACFCSENKYKNLEILDIGTISET